MSSFTRASLTLLLSLGASSSVSAQLDDIDRENCYIARFTTPQCYDSYTAENPQYVMKGLPGIYAALIEVSPEYTEIDLDADPCVEYCYQGE